MIQSRTAKAPSPMKGSSLANVNNRELLIMEEKAFSVYCEIFVRLLSGAMLMMLAYVQIRARHKVRVLKAKIKLAEIVATKGRLMADAALQGLPNCDWDLFRSMVDAVHAE